MDEYKPLAGLMDISLGGPFFHDWVAEAQVHIGEDSQLLIHEELLVHRQIANQLDLSMYVLEDQLRAEDE